MCRSLKTSHYSLLFGLISIFLQTAHTLDLTKTALIIVDVQNDFCAGGPLAIPHGDDVIPVINKLRANLDFGMVVFTMDWHLPNHISFFERFNDTAKHPNAKLFQEYTFDLDDGNRLRSQILWPVHAVQNSTGAELRIGLHREPSDSIVFKGTHLNVDSYSGFVDNDNKSETELNAILKKKGIESLFITGLAYEYCVGNTALHGIDKGYKVTLVKDATGSMGFKEEMTAKLKIAGVEIKRSYQLVHLPAEHHSCTCPTCTCPGCECTVAIGNIENGTIGNLSTCACNFCVCPTCNCI